MILRLIRHSETIWNKEWRFQGSSDVPLSEEGREILRKEVSLPEKVYVTGLVRTSQTADIIFPGVSQIPVPGLNEMDFGIVEGKSHDEMKDNPEYKKWLENGRKGAAPGGESKEEFTERICNAFEKLISDESEETMNAVVHGGTIMAALSRFDIRGRDEYFEYYPANGDGYEIEITGQGSDMKWHIVKHISYRKDYGYTHLYYGTGRGKTSAAMGTALRAIENGYRVFIFQMCKPEGSFETKFLSQNGAKVYYGLEKPAFSKTMSDEQKAEVRSSQTDILNSIMKELRDSRGDGVKKLLILDEACAALQYGVIDEDTLWDAVLRKPQDTELILTGRYPSDWMKRAADYCTEMVFHAHPKDMGITARPGIDK